MAFDIARKIQFILDLKDHEKVRDGFKAVSAELLDTERAVDLAKKAFIGLIGVGSAAAFVGMVKGSIDAAAGLHDLSISTGLSVAALQQFRSVGAYTNTTAEDVANAANKLAKGLSQTTQEGKGAAVALSALGLDFDDFKKLNPEQQMLAVAQAMGGFADGGEKSAAAMLLFGKEGAKLLPFLADLAKEHDTVAAKLTDTEQATRATQAAMADAFGDNLTQIRKESEGWKKDLSMGLMPALWEASEAALGMSKGTGGLKEEISRLAKDGTLAEWARGAITGLTYLAGGVERTIRFFSALGDVVGSNLAQASVEIGGLVAAAKKVLAGDLSGAMQEMSSAARQSAAIAAEGKRSIDELWAKDTLGERMRDAMAAIKGTGAAAAETRPRMQNLADVAARLAGEQEKGARAARDQNNELERAVKAGDELLMTTQRELDAARQQLALGRDLTAAEKALLKLEQDLAASKVVLTKGEYDLVRASIAKTQALRDEERWMKDTTLANEDATRAVRQQGDELRRQLDAQQRSNDAIGLSGRALVEHQQAVDLDHAAILERRAALLDEVDPAVAAELRAQAQGYRDLAAARLAGWGKQAAADAGQHWLAEWRRVGEGMYDAMKGGLPGLKAYIKQQLENFLIRIPVQAFLGDAAQGIGSWIGGQLGIPGLGGGGGGGGVGGLLQGAGQAGSLGNIFNSGGIAGMGASIGAFGNAAAYGFNSVLGGNLTGAFTGGMDLMAAGNFAEGAGSMLGAAGPYVAGAAALYALGKALDNGGTPHRGGYVRADAAGNVQDITRAEGGVQDAATQQLMAQFAAMSASMIETTAKAFGEDVKVAVESVIESDGQDGSWARFRALIDGAAASGEFVNQGQLAPDAATAFAQFKDEAAAAIREALVGLNLPEFADARLADLGAAPSFEALARVLDELQKSQAEKDTATQDTTAAVDSLRTPTEEVAAATVRTANETAAVHAEMTALRSGFDALAAAMTRFAQLAERWNADGMPAVRVET